MAAKEVSCDENKKMQTVSDVLTFMEIVGKLKEVKRTGWIERGVQGPESVADHMYRMAIMTMLITNKEDLDKNQWTICKHHAQKLNRFRLNSLGKLMKINWQEKVPDTEVLLHANLPNIYTLTSCRKLALVHDLAESIVGDISPSQGIRPEEKHRREKEAMDSMVSLLPGDIANEMTSLWEEYANRSTAEARFVKDLDRFEMILQAYEYERTEKRPRDLQDFFDSTHGKFEHQEVKEWVTQLYQRRNKLLESGSS